MHVRNPPVAGHVVDRRTVCAPPVEIRDIAADAQVEIAPRAGGLRWPPVRGWCSCPVARCAVDLRMRGRVSPGVVGSEQLSSAARRAGSAADERSGVGFLVRGDLMRVPRMNPYSLAANEEADAD